MTIYVTMIDDRHTGSQAYLFSTAEKAIAYAHSVLEENKVSAEYVDPDDLFMNEEELNCAGWLFYGCYSTEGDCVWVTSSEIDAEG